MNGTEDTFVNVNTVLQYVYCNLCNANIGERWGGKKVGKTLSISKFIILRVDPRNYGNVCEPVANFDRIHDHKYFVISLDNVVNSKSVPIINVNVQNGDQRFGEVCQYSSFVACGDLSGPEPVNEKVESESINEFIRFFLTELENGPCSSNGAYAMESIQKALFETQIKYLVGSPNKKVCLFFYFFPIKYLRIIRECSLICMKIVYFINWNRLSILRVWETKSSHMNRVMLWYDFPV